MNNLLNTHFQKSFWQKAFYNQSPLFFTNFTFWSRVGRFIIIYLGKINNLVAFTLGFAETMKQHHSVHWPIKWILPGKRSQALPVPALAPPPGWCTEHAQSHPSHRRSHWPASASKSCCSLSKTVWRGGRLKCTVLDSSRALEVSPPTSSALPANTAAKLHSTFNYENLWIT